jgi:hypothetical protein
MTVGSALREFGGFLDEIERAEPVRGVRLTGPTRPDADGTTTLTADVELALSTAPSNGSAASHAEAGGLRLATTTVDSSGRLRLSLDSVDPFLPAAGDRITVDPGDVTVTDGGSLVVVLTVSVRIGDAPDASRTGPVTEAASERTDGGDAVRGNSPERPREAGPDDGNAAATTRPGRDRDVPPFRDHELLEAVYESCETFAEMVDELGMDVSAETVRRYMIDAGVHEPNSYDTSDTPDSTATASTAETDASDETDARIGSDADDDIDADADTEAPDDTTLGTGELTHDPSAPRGDAATDRGTVIEPAGTADRAGDSDERPSRSRARGATETDGDAEREAPDSPVVLTDGIGLPNDVTVERLIDTVKRSGTVYEVTRDIGIERDDAIDMLRELNLLDLVAGRLATEAERDISRDEVIERLREASATQ